MYDLDQSLAFFVETENKTDFFWFFCSFALWFLFCRCRARKGGGGEKGEPSVWKRRSCAREKKALRRVQEGDRCITGREHRGEARDSGGEGPLFFFAAQLWVNACFAFHTRTPSSPVLQYSPHPFPLWRFSLDPLTRVGAHLPCSGFLSFLRWASGGRERERGGEGQVFSAALGRKLLHLTLLLLGRKLLLVPPSGLLLLLLVHEFDLLENGATLWNVEQRVTWGWWGWLDMRGVEGS